MRSSLPLLLLGVALGCAGGASTAPEELPVVYVGEEAQSLAELVRYLDANLVDGEGDIALAPAELDEVKSRVFDAFVRERLLLQEAERRGFGVSDLEVEAYLGPGREEQEAAIPASRWAEARHRLMIQKLQESVVLDVSAVSEVDVKRYLERNRDRLVPERRLRMRTLMLSAEDAAKVHKEIRRRRMTFQEAVVAHRTSDGQGIPLEVGWESLSEDVRTALDKLKAGQVSAPVEMHGDIYLFLVEAWLGDPSSDTDLRERVRDRLESERRQEAFAALLRELHSAIGVTLKLENLPFEYIPEEGASAG